jgi:hypothetical protein
MSGSGTRPVERGGYPVQDCPTIEFAVLPESGICYYGDRVLLFECNSAVPLVGIAGSRNNSSQTTQFLNFLGPCWFSVTERSGLRLVWDSQIARTGMYTALYMCSTLWVHPRRVGMFRFKVNPRCINFILTHEISDLVIGIAGFTKFLDPGIFAYCDLVELFLKQFP